MRDAVDYVYDAGRGRLTGPLREPGRRRAATSTALGAAARLHASPTARCCARRWPTARGAPSIRGEPSQRAARSSSATPCSAGSIADLAYRRYADLPEGKLTELRKSVVNATALAEVADDDRPRRRTCCSARARTPPAGGRSRRSCPTRSRRCSARSTSTAARARPTTFVDRPARPSASTTPSERLDRLDHKTPLQELARPPVRRGARCTSSARTAPTTPSGSSPRCWSTASCSGDGDGRSKKVAEQAAARGRLRRAARRSTPAADA